MLYQLLMEDRYREPIEAGLLWYLSQASPELVTRSPYEVCILPSPLSSLHTTSSLEDIDVVG